MSTAKVKKGASSPHPPGIDAFWQKILQVLGDSGEKRELLVSLLQKSKLQPIHEQLFNLIYDENSLLQSNSIAPPSKEKNIYNGTQKGSRTETRQQQMEKMIENLMSILNGMVSETWRLIDLDTKVKEKENQGKSLSFHQSPKPDHLAPKKTQKPRVDQSRLASANFKARNTSFSHINGSEAIQSHESLKQPARINKESQMHKVPVSLSPKQTKETQRNPTRTSSKSQTVASSVSVLRKHSSFQSNHLNTSSDLSSEFNFILSPGTFPKSPRNFVSDNCVPGVGRYEKAKALDKTLKSTLKGGVISKQKREEAFPKNPSSPDRLDYPLFHFVSRPYVKK